MNKAFRYTAEMLQYLSDNRALMTIEQLTKAFNIKFKTNKIWWSIRAICLKKSILLDNQKKTIGSERVDKRDGYIKVKIAEPSVWQFKTRVVWEAHNGEIPAYHVVRFIDGDKLNTSIENLELISKQELLRLSINGYSNAPEELKPIVRAVSKLETMLFSSRK